MCLQSTVYKHSTAYWKYSSRNVTLFLDIPLGSVGSTEQQRDELCLDCSPEKHFQKYLGQKS